MTTLCGIPPSSLRQQLRDSGLTYLPVTVVPVPARTYPPRCFAAVLRCCPPPTTHPPTPLPTLLRTISIAAHLLTSRRCTDTTPHYRPFHVRLRIRLVGGLCRAVVPVLLLYILHLYYASAAHTWHYTPPNIAATANYRQRAWHLRAPAAAAPVRCPPLPPCHTAAFTRRVLRLRAFRRRLGSVNNATPGVVSVPSDGNLLTRFVHVRVCTHWRSPRFAHGLLR